MTSKVRLKAINIKNLFGQGIITFNFRVIKIMKVGSASMVYLQGKVSQKQWSWIAAQFPKSTQFYPIEIFSLQETCEKYQSKILLFCRNVINSSFSIAYAVVSQDWLSQFKFNRNLKFFRPVETIFPHSWECQWTGECTSPVYYM